MFNKYKRSVFFTWPRWKSNQRIDDRQLLGLVLLILVDVLGANFDFLMAITTKRSGSAGKQVRLGVAQMRSFTVRLEFQIF